MPGIPGSKSGHTVSVKVQVADNFLFADHCLCQNYPPLDYHNTETATDKCGHVGAVL